MTQLMGDCSANSATVVARLGGPQGGFLWGIISGLVITICSMDEVVGVGDVGTQM